MIRACLIAILMLAGPVYAQEYSRWLDVAFFDTMEFSNNASRVTLTVGTAANLPARVGIDLYCSADEVMIYISDTAQPVGETVLFEFANGSRRVITLTPSPNGLGGTTTDPAAIDYLVLAMGASADVAMTYEASGFTHHVALGGAEIASARFVTNCAALQDGSYDLARSLATRTDHAVPFGAFVPLEIFRSGRSYNPDARLVVRTQSGSSSFSAISVTCSSGGYSLIFLDSVTPFPPETSVTIEFGRRRTQTIALRHLGVDYPAYAGWNSDDDLADEFLTAMARSSAMEVSYSQSNYTHVVPLENARALVAEFREDCEPIVRAEQVGAGWVPVYTVDTTDNTMGRRLTLFVRKNELEDPYWFALGCGATFMRLSVNDQNEYQPNAMTRLRYRFDDGPIQSVALRYVADGLSLTYDTATMSNVLRGMATAGFLRFQMGEGDWNVVPLLNSTEATQEFMVGCRAAAENR